MHSIFCTKKYYKKKILAKKHLVRTSISDFFNAFGWNTLLRVLSISFETNSHFLGEKKKEFDEISTIVKYSFHFNVFCI